MFHIDMQHIGKIDAVGTVQVFGYSALRQPGSRHRLADLVYLNYAGPPTAADAIWASLIERRALDFTDLRGRPHRLRHGGYPGLEGKEAPFKRFVTRIESLAIDHCILLDKRFFEPAYDFASGLTFVFEGEDMAARIGYHVSRCVDIAVFPDWYAGLVAIGRRERLIRPLDNWAHPVYQVSLDRARWTNLIAVAVEHDELTWPGEQSSEAAQRLLDAPSIEADAISDAAIDTPLKQALHQHLSDAARTVAVADAIERAKKHGWRGDLIKEREIKRAIYEVVGEEELTEELFVVMSSYDQPKSQTAYSVTHERDWTWLSFDEKPEPAILDRLRAAGFRWGKRRKAWYQKRIVDQETISRTIAN